VFAIVLVLYHGLHLPQTLGKLAAGRRAFIGHAIGITAPVEVHLGQVITALPQTTVNCVLHPGAIGAGLGAKHPPAGLARCQFG